MKKFLFCILLTALTLVAAPAPTQAAWTINSVDTDGSYASRIGTYNLIYVKADLTSDGSAETDIDIWPVLQSTIGSPEKSLIGTGGILFGIIFKQGTDWNGSSDFNLTVYNGYHVPIFSESIDYNESGATISGVTTTGGFYDGSTTETIHPPLSNGLIIDVGDIGDSGDDVILIFILMPGGYTR